jgi:hypothetical protein
MNAALCRSCDGSASAALGARYRGGAAGVVVDLGGDIGTGDADGGGGTSAGAVALIAAGVGAGALIVAGVGADAVGRLRLHSVRPNVIAAPTRSPVAHLTTACSRSIAVILSASFLSVSVILASSPANDWISPAIGLMISDGMFW